MMYRIKLNDILMKDDPAGWDDFITTIKRDYSIKGILKTQDATIIFQGDSFQYLWSRFRATGFTEVVDVLVERSKDYGNNWLQFFTGTIFLAQIEWDEKRNYAKC